MGPSRGKRGAGEREGGGSTGQSSRPQSAPAPLREPREKILSSCRGDRHRAARLPGHAAPQTLVAFPGEQVRAQSCGEGQGQHDLGSITVKTSQGEGAWTFSHAMGRLESWCWPWPAPGPHVATPLVLPRPRPHSPEPQGPGPQSRMPT